MRTVQTHKEQYHRRVSPALLRLEEHVLVAMTLGTLPIGPRQCRIRANILHHTGRLTDIRDQLVTVHQRTGCLLNVRTRTALEQQPPGILVLTGVQHVVAIAAEPERGHCVVVVTIPLSLDCCNYQIFNAIFVKSWVSLVCKMTISPPREGDRKSHIVYGDIPHPHTTFKTEKCPMHGFVAFRTNSLYGFWTFKEHREFSLMKVETTNKRPVHLPPPHI